jgi:hypothetical protein
MAKVEKEEVTKSYVTISPFYTKYNGEMVTYLVGDLVVDLTDEDIKSCLEKSLIE